MGKGSGRKFEELVSKLALILERARIADYMQLLESPRRLIYVNFLAGLARGFGMAVGFTLLGAVVIYVLSRTFVTNLPVVGRFIAEIVAIVQDDLGARR
ncbi:MAG: DUF5665 domain-containing protein [Bacillota bacterium]